MGKLIGILGISHQTKANVHPHPPSPLALCGLSLYAQVCWLCVRPVPLAHDAWGRTGIVTYDTLYIEIHHALITHPASQGSLARRRSHL